MRHALIALILPLALLAGIPVLHATTPAPPPPASPAPADAPPFAQPRAGLYTAGQPTAEQLAQAKAAGVTTVIDLRGAGEDRGFDEPATARALGLRYLSLPVAGGKGVTVETARQLHALLGQTEGPVLLHCASGNRAGALLALAAAHVDGADNASALALGRAAGLTSLAPRVEEQLPVAGNDDAPGEAPAAEIPPAR